MSPQRAAAAAGAAAVVALAVVSWWWTSGSDPPDVWQTFAGRAVQGYPRRGVFRSVALVFERDDLRARMNPTILRSVMRGATPYGVPTGAHGGNVLWFNTGDELDWRSAEVLAAPRRFGMMLEYADPQASGLTWDQATRKLASGRVRLRVDGRLRLRRAGRRRRAGRARLRLDRLPGTDGSFRAVVDVFVAATEARNARNALAFLDVIEDPGTQPAFSRAKGSIPVVRDVDVSSLPPYQRGASKTLWAAPLLSITHGEAMSPAFQDGSTTRSRRTCGRGSRTRSPTTSRTPSPRTSSDHAAGPVSARPSMSRRVPARPARVRP